MKTDSKILASFLAASIWADGEYDEFEKQFVADVCNELDAKTLQAELEAAIAADENKSGEVITDELEAAAKKVADDEKKSVLSLCLQLMCADAFLSTDEVENHFVFADVLGIDEEAAQEILDEFVENEENLIIEEDEEEK